ncbi:outer membrane beta-barrel protein [uncultured Idiomarina sp.]|uniref:outer membrane protein n=1 Tax=uncultured Idiomarina sp. TaxID=352961 RepID=UPI002591A152|nr:outer membrane beta-barrel protein [uncultured Idiomarina sp.]
MRKAAIALAILTLPSAALADSPNWNKVEASYLDTDLGVNNVEDISLDGFRAGGSVAIDQDFVVLKNIFTFADFSSLSEEDNTGSIDLDYLSAGIGSFKSLSDSTDLYATVSFERVELSASSLPMQSISYSENAVGVGLGLRSMVTPNIETNAKIDYIAFDEATVRLDISAFYHLTNSLSFGFGYETYKELDYFDIDSIRASVRYSF